MIRNKTVKFDMEKPNERELWEWLSSMPHGYFSDIVKSHFTKTLENLKSGFEETKPEKIWEDK